MTGPEREALRERIAIERWARVELSRCMARIWGDLAKAETWHAKHPRSGYACGCRCPLCTGAHRDRFRSMRTKTRSELAELRAAGVCGLR